MALRPGRERGMDGDRGGKNITDIVNNTYLHICKVREQEEL